MRKWSQSDETATIQAFGALTEPQRRTLRLWAIAAREAGIDDVKDLTSRGWPGPIAGAVIGVYTPGDDHAAWHRSFGHLGQRTERAENERTRLADVDNATLGLAAESGAVWRLKPTLIRPLGEAAVEYEAVQS